MNKDKYLPIFTLLLFISSTYAESNNSNWSLVSRFVSKIYNDCEQKNYDLTNCLKIRAISFLDRISRNDIIALDDSISLVREGNYRLEYDRALTENEIEDTIIDKSDQKTNKINNMLYDRFSRFLKTRVLKIRLPDMDTASIVNNLEEGRGKMKKTMGMFMMAAMMKAMMMIPISIGLLFILAGKALIISKIALVLSLIITLKKLLNKSTEHVVHESHGWSPSSAAGGWDKRSYRPAESNYDQNVPAQNLAYNSYTNY